MMLHHFPYLTANLGNPLETLLIGLALKLLVTTLEGDYQNLESIVHHTIETTYSNGFYDIFQTNKQVYQPYSKICIDYYKASSF